LKDFLDILTVIGGIIFMFVMLLAIPYLITSFVVFIFTASFGLTFSWWYPLGVWAGAVIMNLVFK